MKKILSVILVLAMVLALGVTAFAADTIVENVTLEAGKTAAYKFDVNTKDYTVAIVDRNGFLTIGNTVIDDAFVAFEVTAPEGTANKLANVVVTLTPKTGDVVTAVSLVVEVKGKAADPVTKPEVVKELVGGTNYFVEGAKASVVIAEGQVGISASVYNTLKNANHETITLQGPGYIWTLTRGDYTKMNVTADILFDVDVDTKLWTKNEKKETVEDTATENAVLKALGSTQAEVFYVTIADNCNIANVASKPALEITVPAAWINFSNKFSVNGYKFDGEAATKVVSGLAVKPATSKLTLNLTAGGTYVFVADNYTVNPAPSTSEKPNASTGANSAAAVVALAVMAVAAVASKKIVK